MHFLDLTLSSPEENIALDEALLLDAEEGLGGEVLRLWQWDHPAVILGSGGKLAEDVNEPACAADGVPVLRRSSGGGTVLLGPGCLCFSLVLAFARDPRLEDLHASYAYILDRVLPRWQSLAVSSQVSATSPRTVKSSPGTHSSVSGITYCTTAPSCTASIFP